MYARSQASRASNSGLTSRTSAVSARFRRRRIVNGRSSGRITSPGTMIMSRSITLRSSRTFPGHAWCASDASASGDSVLRRRPYSRANSLTKCSASRMMSSPRSRSGGTRMGMTLRRKYRSSRKPPLPNLFDELLVRRRDHAHVHADARLPADRLDDLLLKRSQHLRLRLQAHVADFVQEQRAAGRRLELAAPIGDGAGERASHVAEELRLDELFRQRRAVDLDERAGRGDG